MLEWFKHHQPSYQSELIFLKFTLKPGKNLARMKKPFTKSFVRGRISAVPSDLSASRRMNSSDPKSLYFHYLIPVILFKRESENLIGD
jgi:hypothetical protein